MTRREALKGLFYTGMGLAVSGPLLQACRPGAPEAPAGIPWTEAPEGSRIDTRTWSKLGETVGMLGLGCMRFPERDGHLDQDAVNEMIDYAIAHGINYFDSAPLYGESEEVTGRALCRHPRESYFIATKMSHMGGRNFSLEDGRRMFENSLKRLRVDYIDFYLLHSVPTVAEFRKRYIENGLFDYLLGQRAEGRIRHLGFSYHGTNADLPQMLDLYDWDFVQIQVNYVDWKDMPVDWDPGQGETSSESLYNCLADRGIPVVAMEPVKGGSLANVSDALAAVMRERHPELTPAANALTFVGTLPGMMVTLSGMSTMEQLKENVALFTGFKAFDDKDMAFMQTVADLYASNVHIPCTACAYCMPCPSGVNIPGNFRVFNSASDALSIPDPDHKDKAFAAKRKAFLKLYKGLEKGTAADACTTCNACLPKCPQHIRIPDQLKRISDLVSSL
jgi:predicted aldo/keto reductase-like oxidoreductase